MLTEADIFHALVEICTECDETTRNEICDDLIPRLVDDVAEARDATTFQVALHKMMSFAGFTDRLRGALLLVVPQLHPAIDTTLEPAMSWGELAEKYLKGRVV